jgi:hypothetical protein
MSVIPGQTVPQATSGAEVQAEAVIPKQESDSGRVPEPQPSSEIKWDEVLGISQPTEKVRSRLEAPQKREIPQQLVDLSKQNILDAVMITVNADKSKFTLGDNSPLLAVRKIITTIDSNIDFNKPESIDPQKVTAAIERLFQTNPSQAIALGLVFQEYKLSLLRKHYQIQLEQVEAGKKPQEATGPRRIGEMTIDPKTGNPVFNERPMSYEEFIQTPEAQKERRFLFLKWKSLVSKEEFGQMFESEEGKQGKYKLKIEKITASSLGKQEKFILEQLGFYDLNPQNLTDFRWLCQEIQLTTLIRAEIIQATGGHPFEISDLLNTSNYLPEIFKEAQIGEAAQAVTKALEAARTAQAEKTRQELETSRQQQAEKSFRSQLEQRKRKIEEILEKKKEEEKVKGTKIVEQKFTAGTDITDPLIENLQKQGFNLGENGDRLLELAGLKRGKSLAVLRAEAKRIERQLGIENGESKVINQLRQKVDTLEELLRTPETVIQTGNQRIIKPVNVDEARRQLDQYKDKLETFENQFNTWADLSYWESVFETAVEINGQRKTVGEWLEEARKIENQKGQEGEEVQEKEGKSLYEKMSLPQLETELIRINVVLGYFDEVSLNVRSKREVIMSSAVSDEDLPDFYNLIDIESQNKDLYKIVTQVFPEEAGANDENKIKTDLSRKKLLFVLEQAFGHEFIFPTDQNAQTYKDMIAFLRSVDLKNIQSSKDFDDLMKRVRREVNNPQPETNNNGNSAPQSPVNPQTP